MSSGTTRPSTESAASQATVFYTPRGGSLEAGPAGEPSTRSSGSSAGSQHDSLATTRPRAGSAGPRRSRSSERAPRSSVGTLTEARVEAASRATDEPAIEPAPVHAGVRAPQTSAFPGGLMPPPRRALEAPRPSMQSVGDVSAESGHSHYSAARSHHSFERSEVTGMAVEVPSLAGSASQQDVEMGALPGSGEGSTEARSGGNPEPAPGHDVQTYLDSLVPRRGWGPMTRAAVGSALAKFPWSAVHTGAGKSWSLQIGDLVQGPPGLGLELQRIAVSGAAGSGVIAGLHMPTEKLLRAPLESFLGVEVGKTDPARALPHDPEAQRLMRAMHKGVLPTDMVGMLITIAGFMVANAARTEATDDNRWTSLQSGVGGLLGTLALVTLGFLLKVSTRDAEGRQRRVPAFVAKPRGEGQTPLQAADRALVQSLWATATGRNPADKPADVTTASAVFRDQPLAKAGQFARELRNRHGLGVALSRAVGTFLLAYDHPTVSQKLLAGPVGESLVYLMPFIGGLKAYGERKPGEFGTVTAIKTAVDLKAGTDPAAAVLGLPTLVGMGYDAVNHFRSDARRLEVPEFTGATRLAMELPVRVVAAAALLSVEGLTIVPNLVFDAARLLRQGENAKASVASLRRDLGRVGSVPPGQAVQPAQAVGAVLQGLTTVPAAPAAATAASRLRE